MLLVLSCLQHLQDVSYMFLVICAPILVSVSRTFKFNSVCLFVFFKLIPDLEHLFKKKQTSVNKAMI